MEFLRRAANPWNQDVLIGISWDLMWAAVIGGLAFLVAHAVYVWRKPKSESTAVVQAADPAIPDRILRHSAASRAFHWLMTVAMFVLLVTAFFPLVGIRFAWVTIHWIAGVGLLLTIVYHVVHATMRHDLWSMWIDGRDLKEGRQEAVGFLKRSSPATSSKPGKYPIDHKLYHNATAVVTLAAIATGVLMMVRVDTPFWARNPYLLSDQTWGVVYVVHGLSGVALIAMIMAHIYFAVRPEKWWISLSMINGFIGKKEYLAHHDPKRWVVTPGSPPKVTGGGAHLPEGAAQDKQSDRLS
jgi:cytochrome b subunit of formate dehydrogenase